MNSGQPMWSHERDAYSLTKKEKGGRVWEYLEDVVGWMEGCILPLSSENRFFESQSSEKAITKLGYQEGSYQVRSPQYPVWAGCLSPHHMDKPHHMASLSSNSRIWGFCLGTHFLALAVLPPSLSPSFVL